MWAFHIHTPSTLTARLLLSVNLLIKTHCCCENPEFAEKKLPHCSRNDWKGWDEISSGRLRYFHELKDQEVADIMEVNMCSMTWMNLGLADRQKKMIAWDQWIWSSGICFSCLIAVAFVSTLHLLKELMTTLAGSSLSHSLLAIIQSQTLRVPQSPQWRLRGSMPLSPYFQTKNMWISMIPFRSRIVLGDESGTPGMLSRRRGAIISTSSGSARATSPLLAEYSAAKAYVERQGLKWFSFQMYRIIGI